MSRKSRRFRLDTRLKTSLGGVMLTSMNRCHFIIPLVVSAAFTMACQDRAAMAELEKFKAQAAIEEQNKAFAGRLMAAIGRSDLAVIVVFSSSALRMERLWSQRIVICAILNPGPSPFLSIFWPQIFVAHLGHIYATSGGKWGQIWINAGKLGSGPNPA